jgi:shikimate kinase
MNKILLVGYMGTGKSTVGKELAMELSLPFYDLDDIISQKEQMSIKDIFDKKGEIYFRKIEHLVLQDFLKSNDKYVLSLGGGTPCYANNHEVLLYDDISSIYLKTSINEIVDRLLKADSKRPLVIGKNKEDLTEYVAKHLFDRSYFYHQCKYTVLTDGKITSDVVTNIKTLLA